MFSYLVGKFWHQPQLSYPLLWKYWGPTHEQIISLNQIHSMFWQIQLTKLIWMWYVWIWQIQYPSASLTSERQLDVWEILNAFSAPRTALFVQDIFSHFASIHQWIMGKFTYSENILGTRYHMANITTSQYSILPNFVTIAGDSPSNAIKSGIIKFK